MAVYEDSICLKLGVRKSVKVYRRNQRMQNRQRSDTLNLGKPTRTTMSEITLESLARRLEEVERRLNEKPATGRKDWRTAAGMFTGREFSKIADEEARKIRYADREQARQEFGE